ncbi:MAG: glycosyltransferase family 2 protein [Pigmentiphaga sp.]|nr:glycosyltransferase family 2 protein [Pigmentiphaga sp.]
MKLAVMMAVYNAETHLEAAIHSILGQAQPGLSLDVIVVNDGSTDRSGAMLRDMAERHDCIRVIETGNQGVTRARNVALQALAPDTDLVSFLDADDLIPPKRYAQDLAVMRAAPTLQLIYGCTMLFREADPDQTGPAQGSQTATGRTVQLAAGMYRYAFLRQVGLFNTDLRQAEDMDFLLRMFEQAPQYQVEDRICLYYRRHGGNMTRKSDELRRDFARAVLLSIHRRRQADLPSLPSGLFDLSSLGEALEW